MWLNFYALAAEIDILLRFNQGNMTGEFNHINNAIYRVIFGICYNQNWNNEINPFTHFDIWAIVAIYDGVKSVCEYI